ncbi:retrotransposon protein, putative, ty1-copia subclass [Tanacetum coccineum]
MSVDNTQLHECPWMLKEVSLMTMVTMYEATQLTDQEIALDASSDGSFEEPPRDYMLSSGAEDDETQDGAGGCKTNECYQMLDPESDKWLNAMNVEMQSMKDNEYEIWQMDVKTAFLNGHLFKEVYMVQPGGFVNPKYPNRVCKLKRSIYGHLGNGINDLMMKLRKFSFCQYRDEPCVYMKASGSYVTFLILYVDDILIMGNNIPVLQDVKSYLERCFAMKDLGEAAYILGINIYRDRSRRIIGLCQSAYIEKILKRYFMENSKRGTIPMQEKLKLSRSQGASTPAEKQRMQNVPNASAVGSIMYAVRCTRPDVAFAQNITSQFQQNTGYPCYTDAGYLTDADDLKSQTGYVFVLIGGIVDWKSTKQSIFATSSTDAEYIAVFDASKEVVWIQKFIYGLGVVPTIEEPINMYCDNTRAIAIAKDHEVTKGNASVARRFHCQYECSLLLQLPSGSCWNMVMFTAGRLRRFMDDKHNTRNISVIADVDHGKSTLISSLVATSGIIEQEAANNMHTAMTDTRAVEEQNDIYLYHEMTDAALKSFKGEHNGNEHVLNLINSPRHADFSSEVNSDLRITDGALVVVDYTKGVRVQTELVDGEEAYREFQRVIESVNGIISTHKDPLLGDVYPEKGTVAFSTGFHGSAFTLNHFAKMYASKFRIDEEKMMEKLWGDNFYDPKTKEWTTKNTGSGSCKRGFVQFVYEPIRQIIDMCINNRQKEVLWPCLKKLGVFIRPEDTRLTRMALMKCVTHGLV